MFNDPNLIDPTYGDHNEVATNLLYVTVVDHNILNDKLLLIIALVHCEMNMFRSATGATTSFSVQVCGRVVNMNTVVCSWQQYHYAHF